MLKARKTLGLFITESHIRAVELGPGGAVLGRAELALTEQLNLSQPERLGKELRQVLRRAGLKANRCLAGVPASWIACREKLLPTTQADALRGILAISTERDFASAEGELSFDYCACPVAGGTAALLAAAPQRQVQQVVEMARAAGLVVQALTPSIVALAAATDQKAQPAARLVLCLSAGAAELAAQWPQGLRLVRSLALSPDAGNPAEALTAPLRRILPLLPNEPSGTQPPVLVWDLDGRMDQSQADELGQRLGLSVRLAVWKGLGLGAGQTLDTLAWAPAAALAALGGKPAAPLDFLHSRLVPPRQLPLKRWLVPAGVVAVVLGVSLYFFLDWRSNQQEVVTLSKTLEGMRDDSQRASALIDNASFAQGWYGRRPQFLAALKEIVAAFPDEGRIWVTRIDMKEDMQVLLSGKGINEDAAMALVDRLRANPRLNVSPLPPISQVGGNSQDISFAISLTIKEAK